MIGSLVHSGELRGRRDLVTYLHGPHGLASGRLLLVGMGPKGPDVTTQLRRAIGVGVRYMRGKRHGTVAIADRVEIAPAAYGQLAAEAVALSAIDLSAHKTIDRDDLNVESAVVATSSAREAEVLRGVSRGIVVAEAANLTRDLGNEPGDRMTPSILAERAVEMARANDLAYDVLDEERMKELGMGAI